MNKYRLNLDKFDSIFPQAYVEGYSGNCEPGYDDVPVLLADWNHVPNHVFDRLEELGYDCEWSDEWIACDECYRVFRTSPDSYGWQMAGIIGDGWVACLDCLDANEHYESMHNNPRRAVTMPIADRYPPEDHGYTLVKDDYENGWHPGQNDNPEAILAAALDNDPDGLYLFVMTGQGQFDLEFALYRKDEGV